VEVIFDMPAYFKSGKANKNLKIPIPLVKAVNVLKAKLEVSIYLTK
jgi:hypothetical protein